MVSNSCSVHVSNNTWLMTQFNDHLLQIETCKNFNDMLLHLAKYFMNGDIFCKTKNWEFKEFNRLVKVQLFWEGHKYLRNLPHGLDIYLVIVRDSAKKFGLLRKAEL